MNLYICLIKNIKTGKYFYNTDCLYSSVEELKKSYETYENLKLIRAWEAKDVDL